MEQVKGSISPLFYSNFFREDPKYGKKTDGLIAFFALLGSVCVKAASKMLVKSTPCNLILDFFLIENA